ncbi:helix-turn-helix transcriptional regulator [Streptomyces pimonensis]|uniref:Helix-turn-helix transcriptional regulator n=1 Tax=Streptomyces pimonensis TaxID=2860288 RepID=A0ABV4J1K8_9ACTN
MSNPPAKPYDDVADEEPAATPLPRLGWRMQAALDVLLEDPCREVWPYWLDQRSHARGDNHQILKRLAEAGWLTTRRETDKPNARVLYRFTAAGEALAREAVERPVRWPEGVTRRR